MNTSAMKNTTSLANILQVLLSPLTTRWEQRLIVAIKYHLKNYFIQQSVELLLELFFVFTRLW